MKRERHIGRFLLALAVACSVGLYAGHSLGETVKAQEDAQVHIVDQGETLWEIARPIADERGMDIREVVRKHTEKQSRATAENIYRYAKTKYPYL